MKYTNRTPKKRWPKRLLMIALIGIVLVVSATVAVRYIYDQNLGPVSDSQEIKLIEVQTGATVEEIAKQLEDAGVIRSAWAFKLYVSSKEVRNALQAGGYELTPSQSVPEIVSLLTHGKVVTNLFTIVPGQRLDQISKRFAEDGFSKSEIVKALDPATHAGHPALVDKPAGASLEGYLYPESYQKNTNTSATTIVNAALDEMNKRLTPDLRAAFAARGLSTYQAITLASIVEREVPKQSDREQVAQVFLKRLREGIRLQSDATGTYGAVLAGQETPSSSYNSAYNTYRNPGLPPTPISNVTESSLRAVARPANTDWLYFVSGDDGTTHFAHTLAQQEANIAQYCKKTCSQ